MGADHSPRLTQIGAYKILSLLGAGGMGEVYRARDPTLARDVALKILPHELAHDPERRARLVREARAAAALNHPNICTVHEVGDADGQIYIAMEAIDGASLSARIAKGPLDQAEVLRLALQLADALAHAHDRGVVHRDLKSGNVMVTPEGRLKVLDFGLAASVGGQEHADVSTGAAGPLTGAGMLLGTLPYMAPEVLRGQTADTRSDIWAFGVVLYELAAGTRPFGGATPFEVSSSILHDAPPPLPVRVPEALQAVIRRCLEKEPARRYQRASEARAALEVAASGAHARDGSPRRGLAGGARRAALAGTVLLVAMAGAIVWRSMAPSNRPVTSIAVLPLENLSSDREQDYFVAGMHEALITDLARMGVQKVIAKPSADAYAGTKKSPAEIGRELGVDGLITGSVMRGGDRLRITAQLVRSATGEVLWSNRYERNAGDVLSLQNELVTAIAREVQAKTTAEQTARLAPPRPINPAAHDAYLKGRSLYANLTRFVDRPHLNAAIAQLEQAIALDPTYAPPYAALSVAHQTSTQTSFVAPSDSFPKARAAALKAIELDDQLAEAHAALGGVLLWFDWNWTGAEREVNRALQLNPNSVDALTMSEVDALLANARFDEAERISQRILSLDPLNPFARVQTVWVSFFSRRHDESTRRAKGLLELFPEAWFGNSMLASNYAVRHMRDEAGVECRNVMARLAGHYDMQGIGMCVWALGVVGQTDEARRLLKIVEQPPSGLWLDPVVMGNAYGGLGDIDRAMAWYEKGIEQRSPNMLYMNTGAPWDPARGDPRFEALLRKMNFPRRAPSAVSPEP